MPTTNYQVPAQKALTLSTVHVLEDMHQLQGKKGLPPPPVYCGRQAKGQEGYMGPGHGGLGTHTPYKRHRYMEPWHECVDAKKENQEIVTNCGRKAY